LSSRVRRLPKTDRPASSTSAPEIAPAQAFSGWSIVVGWIVPGSRPDRIAVDFEGSPEGAVVARSAVPLDSGALVRAANERQGAVLAFERGDLSRPVVLGLLAAPPTSPLLDSVIDETRRRMTERPATGTVTDPAPIAPPQPGPVLEARLDGRRVVLDARDEIVLRCGDASITLRRDGKLLIKGAYVETRAKGVNRIKGGAVKIN
jgi:hypothetical protein